MPHIPGKHEVIDCTFRGGRKQSDMLKEVDIPIEQEKEPELPISLTTEQMTRYCLQTIHSTQDQQKRRVFAEFLRIIEENTTMKAQLQKYKLRELREQEKEETPDDIQE